ncbi:MAG: DUF4381 domain-containing protein [Gammaproteobacteria bacterium]|nr:DUF4381 domain-containing protein [Gammaproteobacteria bacterium]MCY4357557.1 DUF4381 domain-containing protein [Gammaproteobacteria bacterium]
MDSEELLVQLADIHLPEPVSMWPPALGWWLLAVLFIAATVWFGRRLMAVRNRRKICRRALAELDRCYQALLSDTDMDADQLRLRYVNAVNSVLRRVALVHFPRSQVAGLSGAAWVDFLRQNGDASQLTDQLATALGQGRFQRTMNIDVEALYALSEIWIKSVYMERKRQGVSQPGADSSKVNSGNKTARISGVLPET